MSLEVKWVPADAIQTEPLRSLLISSIYNPTADRVSHYLRLVMASGSLTAAAFVDDAPVGIVVYEQTSLNHFTIRLIYVLTEHRNRGIARLLIDLLIRSKGAPIIEAETDDDAVGFYHSLGFRVRSLGQRYPGIERYQCLYDRPR
jgi:ribosomal protein S18 acetylase RimI-like enzyme